jgi:hypothetical protein
MDTSFIRTVGNLGVSPDAFIEMMSDPAKTFERITSSARIGYGAIRAHVNLFKGIEWPIDRHQREDIKAFYDNISSGVFLGAVKTIEDAVTFSAEGMKLQGWSYGRIFNKENKRSPLVCGFDELREDIRDALPVFLSVVTGLWEMHKACQCSECVAKREGRKGKTESIKRGTADCVLVGADESEAKISVQTRNGKLPASITLNEVDSESKEQIGVPVEYGITKEFRDGNQVYRECSAPMVN